MVVMVNSLRFATPAKAMAKSEILAKSVLGTTGDNPLEKDG